MNIFMPYTQGEAIEDNVSRSLAIVLEGNQLLYDRLADLISAKLARGNQTPVAKPESPEDFSIEIQRRASDIAASLEGIRRIIPVTLTPEEAVKEDIKDGASDPETDICIVSGNGEVSDIVIIEVKIASNIAEAQVKHQASTIIKMNDSRDNVSVSQAVNLTWKEIVKLLLSVSELQGGKDFLLDHYLTYLKQNYTEWFPAEPFSPAMNSGNIQGRLDVLANNCANILSTNYPVCTAGSTFTPNGRKISLGTPPGYLREFHIVADFGNDDKLKAIVIKLWPGNNAAQSWQLFGDGTNNNMSWTALTALQAGSETLKCSVSPYLKFSHINGRFVMSAYLLQSALGTDKSSIVQKFGGLNGTWTRTGNYSWAVLKQNLLNASPAVFSDEEAERFKSEFAANFENSGKNFTYVSLGYEISIEIPVSKLEALDKNFSHRAANQDDTAQLTASAVNSILGMM